MPNNRGAVVVSIVLKRPRDGDVGERTQDLEVTLSRKKTLSKRGKEDEDEPAPSHGEDAPARGGEWQEE